MPNDCIEVIPLTGTMGAEVRGVDLSAPLSNEMCAQIHQAFLDHLMIYFRNQHLTPQKQVEIARAFGKPAIYPFLKGLDDAPEVNVLLKTEKDIAVRNFGGNWHSDTTYKAAPDLGTLLYAVEVPPAGGDTLFANMYQAYDALSDGMKALLDGLVCLNSSERGYAGGRAASLQKLDGMKKGLEEKIETFENAHPVVRTHPETGRKGLYVNGSHSFRFKDMSEAESKPLLDFLCAHAVRPEFTCRLRWEANMLAIWDNRCTQHLAVNDYVGQRRLMHRVTVEGDRPR